MPLLGDKLKRISALPAHFLHCVTLLAPMLPWLLYLASQAVGEGIMVKPGLPVVVFDPTQPAQQEFATLTDFAASPYG